MKIVIAGGGTAGWLTALYTQRVYPEYDITLIESEEIGILGAGEGSTPILESLMSFLDIDLADFMQKTQALIKNGIKFSNWNSDGSYYYHPFRLRMEGNNDFGYSLNTFLEQDSIFSHIYAAKKGHSMSDYVAYHKICEQEKVPFGMFRKNLFNFGDFGYHFNARELAKYFRFIAESRGVKRIEGKISKIDSKEDGYISGLWVDDLFIDLDFVFDCTGFARLIIGKHFNSKWKSHAEHLPAKKAIPFFLPSDEKLPPFTESRAMKYGWMWKIPVQGRYGCGYVFDSDFISDDEAKKEIDDFVGFEVESPKTFSFNAGYYEEIWKKNCVAIGLSSGFIEPLEATSIMQSIHALNGFLTNRLNFTTKNQDHINRYNQIYSQLTQEVVDFIYLHYITDRKDTRFWSDFTKNNKMPGQIEYILSVTKERPLNSEIDFVGKIFFSPYGYHYVMIGNNIISKNTLINYEKSFITDKSKEYLDIISLQDQSISNLLTHKEFIELSAS